MSAPTNQAASPTNRSSLLGWVKNLKRGALLLNENIHDYSDNELMLSESKSPTRSMVLGSAQNSIPFPASRNENSPPLASLDLLRPLLNHKSRSTNNVNRVRSNSASASQNPDIRLHRDSFLQNNPLVDENSKYFGVPLAEAIGQASAKISILGSRADDVLQYGRIPIVVAKCGVYLKKHGLTVEGIFRVGGLSKRIKELQIIFNRPPDFGKKLNWDGYTVHDAASLLRRYLNALPEPLIPLDLYEEFRDPLRKRPRVIKYMKYKAENPLRRPESPAEVLARGPLIPVQPGLSASPLMLAATQPVAPETQAGAPETQPVKPETQPVKPEPQPVEPSVTPSVSPSVVQSVTLSVAPSATQSATQSSKSKKVKNYKKLTRDVYDAIEDYKQLLDDLPLLSKQLLFYILDLLAMVQNNSNENLMSSRNLAAIFQPSILLHPNHDMDPEEYALSQSVVEFLIQYAYKLLPSDQLDSESPKPDPSSASNCSAPHLALASLGLRTPGRQHSKSLSAPDQDDLDLIGYRNSKSTRGMPISDTEHDFASTDSDGSESAPKVPKVRPHLFHVAATKEFTPPIVVSEAKSG